jgi:hypothetical protein
MQTAAQKTKATYDKEYRAKNRDEILVVKKAYRAKNKAKIQVYQSAHQDKFYRQNTARNKFNRNKWKEWIVKNNFHYCELCGYARCFRALEFHHLDPATKQFTVSAWISNHAYSTKNEAILEAELQNCIRVCSNCHREIHDDFINLLP